MTHYFDPPGWITDRTYELHKGGLSYDADRKQAEAEADDKFGAEEGSDLKSEPSELLRRSVTACNSPLMADERCALVLAGDSDAANAIDTQRAMRLMLTELNEAEDTYEAVLDEFGDCARCLRGALNFFLGTYTESLVDRYGREAAMAYIETTLAQALDDNA